MERRRCWERRLAPGPRAPGACRRCWPTSARLPLLRIDFCRRRRCRGSSPAGMRAPASTRLTCLSSWLGLGLGWPQLPGTPACSAGATGGRQPESLWRSAAAFTCSGFTRFQPPPPPSRFSFHPSTHSAALFPPPLLLPPLPLPILLLLLLAAETEKEREKKKRTSTSQSQLSALLAAASVNPTRSFDQRVSRRGEDSGILSQLLT